MKYAILEIPTEIHTELTQEMIKRGIEIATTGISADNDIILKVGYDQQTENEMEELKAFIHLLQFIKIIDRIKKRKMKVA
jgi:hypothetical protein